MIVQRLPFASIALTLTANVSSAVIGIICQLESSESTIRTSVLISPSETVIVTSAVINSYLASNILAPLVTGSQTAGAPALNWPSAVFVQFSIGNTTVILFPRTSILVVLIYTRSSAVIDVEEVASSRLCISP